MRQVCKVRLTGLVQRNEDMIMKRMTQSDINLHFSQICDNKNDRQMNSCKYVQRLSTALKSPLVRMCLVQLLPGDNSHRCTSNKETTNNMVHMAKKVIFN